MDYKPPRVRFHEGPAKGSEFPDFRLTTNNLPGFRLIESAYPSGFELHKHSHEYACFYIVLEGSLTERFGKRSRECGPMSMVFSPPDETHSDSFHRVGGRCFILEIAPERLTHLREFSLVLDDSAQFHGGLLAWLSIRAYNESHCMDEVSPLVIESLAVEIMAEVSRNAVKDSERKPPRWIERAREMLHADFSGNPTLACVAEAIGVHPVHLARVFRQFYCCTTGEYVRRLRIEFASRELSASDTPLAAISSAAGFSDQSHFSRTFRRYTGLTPAEFRKGFRLG